MENLILPFKRGKKDNEKKKKLKDGIGKSIALSHKAKSKIREADIEFEKAIAEVMDVMEGKKIKEPKHVEIIGKKSKQEKKKAGESHRLEIRALLQKEMGEGPETEKKEESKEEKKKEKPKKETKKEEAGGEKKRLEPAKKPAKKEEKEKIPTEEKKKVKKKKKKKRKKSKKKAKKEKKEPKKAESGSEKEKPKPEKKGKEGPKPGPVKEKKEKPKKEIVQKAEKWGTFYFWYSSEKASSLEEFRVALKKLSKETLNHHAIHNDFSKYLKEFCNDEIASKAEELENLFKSGELRKKLLALLE